eukprot:GDKJ01038338.1.p1 GENE.GDKJ01038338.1~~GDKJ01038338.1.p1  ORF type:complete len:124 (-),score=16.27 GDKJ01038338.1:86-457(-)
MFFSWLRIAGLSGASAVALGAFGAHGLKKRVSEYHVSIWKTGAEYQLVHSVALLGIGILAKMYATDPNIMNKLNIAGRLFCGGIIIFSGSLYMLALTDKRVLGAITPIGGLMFIGGWLALCFL